MFSLSFHSSDTLSLPNYTGSLGYGEKHVKALVGTAGALDVQDCMATIRHLIQLGIAKEGPGNQFIYGGSHGGFLGAHCQSVHLHYESLP